MGGGFEKWRMLPLGVLIFCAVCSLNVVVFGPNFVQRPSSGGADQAPRAANAAATEAEGCSGALAKDYACYQKRYRDLVREEGVERAFVELKAEYEEGGFVRTNCHQMTHVVGRAALERYGDVPGSYAKGDSFCWSGYYHGAMEAAVARIGPERILSEANGICADLGDGRDRYSFYHYNCVHGLGHGFMLMRNNELLEALAACDTLLDAWERDGCYGGAFMENVVAGTNNPARPSTRYLDPARPLYPCTDLAYQYKDQCYGIQTSYALEVQGDDFSKVFTLCGQIEPDFWATCYGGIGRDASGRSNNDPAKIEMVCALGAGYEARSGCVNGAATTFVSYYDTDAQARELCYSVDPILQPACLQATAEYYATL